LCVPPCILVPDRGLDGLTDSYVKLHILDDTQELLNNNHHKIPLNNDEDTITLVEESALTTSEIILPGNSNPSTGNAPIDIEYYCYDIEADAPQFNDHGPKIMIPMQELHITI
jgi:hypothetical protein